MIESRPQDTKLGILIATFLLSAPAVSAGGNPFSQITDLIQQLVVAMGGIVDFKSGNEVAALRVLLFFLFFTLFYMGARTVFSGTEKVNTYATALSLIISLAAVIIIPEAVMNYILETFGAILIVILLTCLNGIPIWFMYGSSGAKRVVDNTRLLGGVRVFVSVFLIFFLGYMTTSLGPSVGGASPSGVPPTSGSAAGSLGSAVMEIIGTINGFLFLLYGVTFFIGVYQLFVGDGISSNSGTVNMSSDDQGRIDKARQKLGIGDDRSKQQIEDDLHESAIELAKDASEFDDKVSGIRSELQEAYNKLTSPGKRVDGTDIAGHIDNVRKLAIGDGDSDSLKEIVLDEMDQLETEVKNIEDYKSHMKDVENSLQILREQVGDAPDDAAIKDDYPFVMVDADVDDMIQLLENAEQNISMPNRGQLINDIKTLQAFIDQSSSDLGDWLRKQWKDNDTKRETAAKKVGALLQKANNALGDSSEYRNVIDTQEQVSSELETFYAWYDKLVQEIEGIEQEDTVEEILENVRPFSKVRKHKLWDERTDLGSS